MMLVVSLFSHFSSRLNKASSDTCHTLQKYYLCDIIDQGILQAFLQSNSPAWQYPYQKWHILLFFMSFAPFFWKTHTYSFLTYNMSCWYLLKHQISLTWSIRLKCIQFTAFKLMHVLKLQFIFFFSVMWVLT